MIRPHGAKDCGSVLGVYVHYVSRDGIDTKVRGFFPHSGLCLCLGSHWFVGWDV